MATKLVCLTVLVQTLPAASAAAQVSPIDAGAKHVEAFRVSDGSIRLDGHLDEGEWKQATSLNDFVQKEPNEGAQPGERTEVYFLYDSTALLIGARMWSADPAGIQAPLGRRDDAGQAEHVAVSLDSHRDRLTAYTFGVTAAGVRIDHFHPRDDENFVDAGFDPVWDARTTITSSGWTAELWIPFSQIRFNDQPEQIWGLNVFRFIPTLNEKDYWVPVPRTVTAWSSRFGELRGLGGLRATRRLELLPYIAGATKLYATSGTANPFESGRNLAGRAGLDLKMGLGPSLTLQVTVNPDFGQVEADPAEVNLTAFESIFPEKRQFFTESARLLNLEVQTQLFHSRRIGARPTVAVPGSFVDYPDSSTIISAGKLTGRTSSGTSIGLLGAVTDSESASVSNLDGSLVTSSPVGPRTTFGVGRIQQEFGRSGSTVSVMATSVHRHFREGDGLAQVLPRSAVSGGADSILRLRGGEYDVRIGAYGTHVSGEPAAIERVQRSAVHYLQRPDREHSRLDPSRASISGYRAEVGVVRRSGRHWLWDSNIVFESPSMEPNDAGRTSNTDNMINNTNIRYRETLPGKWLRNYAVTLTTRYEMNYDRDIVGRWLRPSMSATFNNFWTLSGGLTQRFRGLDPALTRGGPLMQRPAGWTATATLSSASTGRTTWSGTTMFTGNEDGGRSRQMAGSLSFRVGPRWRISVNPSVDRTIDDQQYVTTVSGGGAGTFGNRYIFSYIDRSTLASEIRMGFTLRPDVNLDVYAEPFASSGRYYDLGELVRAGERLRLPYGSGGTIESVAVNGDRMVTTSDGTFIIANRDFRVRSMRSNVVLRWEWRPGSTLYMVWQQDRSIRDTVGHRAAFGDLFRAMAAPGSNFFVVKTSYWLPL
jgi:hypothetical protein